MSKILIEQATQQPIVSDVFSTVGGKIYLGSYMLYGSILYKFARMPDGVKVIVQCEEAETAIIKPLLPR